MNACLKFVWLTLTSRTAVSYNISAQVPCFRDVFILTIICCSIPLCACMQYDTKHQAWSLNNPKYDITSTINSQTIQTSKIWAIHSWFTRALASNSPSIKRWLGIMAFRVRISCALACCLIPHNKHIQVRGAAHCATCQRAAWSGCWRHWSWGWWWIQFEAVHARVTHAHATQATRA